MFDMHQWSLADATYVSSSSQLAARNTELDAELRELTAKVSETLLHDEIGGGIHTLAEQLGHLAELQAHLAVHIKQWLDGQRLVVGRGEAPEADRDDAIMRASVASLDELLDELTIHSKACADMVDRLTDDHLLATVTHVVGGRRPLVSVLERDLLCHKAKHIRDLHATLTVLTSS